MITTLDHTIKQHILSALEEAKHTEQSVLVSRVKEISAIDPLHFMASGEEIYLGERFFWSTPSGDFMMVGLGNELVLEVDQNDESDRFQKIENQWKRFKKVVISESEKQVGTGPLMFGGFSFDPAKEKSKLWNAFPEAKFVLPTVMLSVVNEKAFITINKMVTPYDSLDTCVGHFEQQFEDVTSKIDLHLNYDQNKDFASIELSTTEWVEAVQRAAAEIRSTKMNKVVLAREVHLEFKEKINPYEVVGRLQLEQPTSFIFEIENGFQHFIGATPERLVKKKDSHFLSTCLAGSIKRGKTVEEDHELGKLLLNDAKNLVEHDIVVKMIKETFQQSCYEIEAPEKPVLFRTKNIQHLYTPVRGLAKDGQTLLSMVKRLHPTPALGGFPKEKAIKKIRELEPMHRGWYAAPVGWFDHEDNGEFVVAIRSGLIEGNKAALFAGCGIVGESDPETEYFETKIKLKPMLSALGGVENE